ncbi:putative dinucleotide-binding enzyme [Bradyrhizobium sp. AZCC 1610]|uniref:NADPH-dependent F420 reductase n=1 Tax=Bradyrhizobium sp. AZCC 1610 TaxID=3117020 RepID=UPI002FF2752F
MRVAVIGAGAVGRALGRAWVKAGHDVVYGARTAGVKDMASFLAQTGGREAPGQAAALAADVVVLALPWGKAEPAVRGLGDLNGKVVIDCMNPLIMRDGALGLECGFETSGAERVAAWLPGARVVKTLNQAGAEVMGDTTMLSARPVMFLAGDDAAAKDTARALVAELGFEPLDAGPLSIARLLEPLAMVWINQAILRGEGRDWAFTLARRRP